MNQLSEKRFIVESVMKITDCNEDKSRIVKVITDKEELYSYDDLYEISYLLNMQQATIKMYQRRVNKREEQISIIKKYCLKFLTDEQFETIRKELENG